ncbi:DUF6249 domain-containing protein [Negadavirga shengliensis]|uniref:DUF6249 domain-containing protein n=1 Tax=Negadavirga shengliensis TaxID=1389218 RepID=A0ABV9T043_9BACT
MAVAIVFISFFATAFGIWFYSLKTRNSERLALIQSGADASLFYSKKKARNYNAWFIVLILGMVFLAVGLGIITGHFMESLMIENERSVYPDHFRRHFPQAYFTSIFVFTGLSLISAYFLIRKLNKQDEAGQPMLEK